MTTFNEAMDVYLKQGKQPTHLDAFNAGFKSGLKRAMEIAEKEEYDCHNRDCMKYPEMTPDAESGCIQVFHAIEAEMEQVPPK